MDEKKDPYGLDTKPVITMFGVVLMEDGGIGVFTDASEMEKFSPSREATPTDILRACLELREDLSRKLLAQTVIEAQMQVAQAMQQAQANQRILQKVQHGGKGGLIRP